MLKNIKVRDQKLQNEINVDALKLLKPSEKPLK